MSDAKVTVYPGKLADVSWDGRLCIHVSECTRADGELFVSGRKPWGDPDAVSPDEAAEVVARCPSGALSIVRKDGGPAEAPPAENTIVVSHNGPLYVRGELAIEGAPDDMPGVKTRAALCRCGQSKSKPFCDGSHEAAGFRDSGAIGQAGAPLESSGGPLRITPSENGPLLVYGNVTLLTGHGLRTWQGEKTALCRCGHSSNKPFCDGTHAKIGFQSS